MPRFRSPKFLGEQAECAFMKAAMDRGLLVSMPFGDSAGYDVIVDTSRPYDLRGKRRGRLWRVQVKCASRCNNNEFQFHGWRSSTRLRLTITARDTDFLACYVIPYDTWYIIPVRALTSQAIYLRPHIPHSRGRFEPFRERWDLLGARAAASE